MSVIFCWQHIRRSKLKLHICTRYTVQSIPTAVMVLVQNAPGTWYWYRYRTENSSKDYFRCCYVNTSMMIQFNGLLLFYYVNTSMMIQFNGLLLQSWPKSWRLRTRLGRELSLVCVEVSLARNEPPVRGGQSLTKTIGIKVCGSFCHRISVTRSP